MSAYVPFLVAGLVTGSVYAIAATGLVLTYRTTGLFNFAHGGVSMVVGFAFHQLRSEWSVATPIAFVLSLFVVGPLVGVVIDRLLFRNLQGSSQAARIVVTIGLLVFLSGGAAVVFGSEPRQVEPFLSQATIDLGTVNLGYDQLTIIAIGLVVLVGLLVFFRSSRLGLAMRAVVDNRTLVRLGGFSAGRISSITWALGTTLAGLAGILFVPLVGLDTVTLVLLVVKAYAAAVFGRLTDLRIAYLAAILLGLIESLSLKVFAGYPTLVNGIRPSIPFLCLFGYLAFVKRGRLRELGVAAPWEGSVRSRPFSRRVQAGWVGVGVLAVFALSPTRLFVFGFALALACIFVSLGLLIGMSGQINLAHTALVGTGAFVYIHATVDWGVPFLFGLLIAAAAVIPLGLLIAVPALRLPSLFLALATFGFGLLVDGLIFTSIPFSGGQNGLIAHRPSLLSGDRAYVLFLLVMLCGFIGIVGLLRRSALGRTLVALRDSPTATETLGVDQLWPRFAIFAVSAGLGGLGGGLYAGMLQAASKTYFNTFTSLSWVAVVVVGGVQSPAGAVLAAFLLAFAPELIGNRPDLLELVAPVFGLGAIVLAKRPGGLLGLLRSVRLGDLVTISSPRGAPVPASGSLGPTTNG
ncbi:MAG: ABC transporter permease [Acidimicrobiia bacterium]|nr:ABC transporter permease [Acidimicrobiia bacterium]